MKSFRTRFVSALVILLAVGLIFQAGGATARPGDLVPTFGQDGISSPAVGSSTGQASEAVIQQPDGKTIVVGHTASGPGSFVARYLADGTPDTTFGISGAVESPGDGWDAVDLQEDGRIVVSGEQAGKGVIARFTDDGSLDPGFGTNGRYVFDPTPLVEELFVGEMIDIRLPAIKVTEDGNLRAAGTFFECDWPYGEICSNLLLVGLDANGSPDPGYAGGSGFGLAPQPGLHASLLYQDDGSLIVVREITREAFRAGFENVLTTSRIDAAGQVDPSYGQIAPPTYASISGVASMLTLDPAGRLFVGTSGPVMRFAQDGTYEQTLATGTPSHDIAYFLPWKRPEFHPSDIAIDTAGRIMLAGGPARGQCDGWNLAGAVARILPEGGQDVTFNGDGLAPVWYGTPQTGCPGIVPLRGSVKFIDQNDGSIKIAGAGPTVDGSRVYLAELEAGESPMRECAGRPADFIGTNAAERLIEKHGTFVMLGGNDRVLDTYGSTVCAGPGNDAVAGRGGRLRIFGDSGKDMLMGSWAPDEIHGGPGSDRIRGAGGDDQLSGDAGQDRVSGGARDDGILGGPGRDILKGGKGRDQLRGGSGRDRLQPGPTGPLVSRYKGTFGGVDTSAERVGRTWVRLRVEVELTCVGKESRPGTGSFTRSVLGRRDQFSFRTPESQRDIDDLAWINDIDGRVRGRQISGRVGIIDSDHFAENYTCWSGRSLKNPWVRFRAKLQPRPKQFARQ